MEEKEEWVFFKEIDWDCPKNNRFNIDTRDFHCGYNWTDESHPDYHKIEKLEKFFFTKEELVSEIERLFNESSGIGKWRMLQLICSDARVVGWNLKYLRVWRTDKGFLICNRDNRAIPKDIISCKVNQEYLVHQNK